MKLLAETVGENQFIVELRGREFLVLSTEQLLQTVSRKLAQCLVVIGLSAFKAGP